MAASSFQSLYAVVGNRALDEVVPSLMVALQSSHDEQARARALNGKNMVVLFHQPGVHFWNSNIFCIVFAFPRIDWHHACSF